MTSEDDEQSKNGGSEVASSSDNKCKMMIVNSNIFEPMSSKNAIFDNTMSEQSMGAGTKKFTIVNNNVMGEEVVSENFENGDEIDTANNRGQFIKLSETTKSFPSYIYS